MGGRGGGLGYRGYGGGGGEREGNVGGRRLSELSTQPERRERDFIPFFFHAGRLWVRTMFKAVPLIRRYH